MKKATSWRLASDYIGAGRFVVSPEGVVVGTEYGVQSVSKDSAAGAVWRASLGSRCVGVVAGPGGTVLAACVDGLHVLSANGEERWGTHSLTKIVYAPVPLMDGVLLTTDKSIHFIREWSGSDWRFDFSEVLGQSVESVRVINVFELDGHAVVGVVDYDTGVGRVLVIHGKSGRRYWMSDPGPISDLFAAGQAVFAWCQTGYGKFETRMTRLDGHEIWVRDFAGVGSLRPDGSLAMVIGSNESPEWDDWEYRQVSPGGRIERGFRGRGRCGVRPICRKDGTVYFLGSLLPLDPTASRADYTHFFSMPQEVLFQHLMGIKPLLPEYDIYLHRLRPGASSLEIVYQRSSTYSLGELQMLSGDVVFSDGKDIVAVEA
jgi:hypothetical protein